MQTFLTLSIVILLAIAANAQTISGVVTDTNRSPIQYAEVKLFDGPRIAVQTETDAEGRFVLNYDLSRNHLFHVTAKGFFSFSKVLDAPSDDILRIVLEPAPLDESVTISVTRTESRLNDTPASVVVLDREILESTAAQTVDDSLRQIAGFTLFRRSSSKHSNPTTQGANLRGVSGSGASRAAVLLDGLSLNDAFGGWTFWSRVPQIAIEQAEVLRGGASSFYGTGGLSGAVNLITSQASESPIFRVQTSAGSHGTYDGSLFAAAGKNGWNFDLAAETFQTAGYIPITENERGIVDTPANSRHNNGIFTLARTFGSDSPPSRRGGRASRTGWWKPLTARTFLRGNLFAERRDNGTSLTYNRTYFRQGAAGLDFSNESLGSFQFRTYIEAQVYDQTFSAVSNNRNIETLSRLQRVPSQAAGASLFWTRQLGEHSIAASIETREVRGFSDEVGYFGGRPTSLSGSGGHERTYSIFAQDIWRVSQKLVLNFGGRFDRWTNFDAQSTTRTIATNQTALKVFADRSETAFSPRVAALYQITENISAYASFSKSFRAPTLNELYRGFRVGNVVTNANENLGAERAETFETGINLTGFRKKAAIRGNVFVTDVSDPVVSVTLSTTPAVITRQRQNVGQTRTRGLEVDAEFSPRNELRFSAGYLLVDSRVTKFPSNPELIGNFLPQIARQQLTFQAAYRPRRFSIALQGRISDAQFEDDQNVLRLRPYVAIDLFASYQLRRNLQIFAAAENVFDKRYDIGLTPNLTVAAPRFVRVGLRFDLRKR